jgi:hypothetical protein
MSNSIIRDFKDVDTVEINIKKMATRRSWIAFDPLASEAHFPSILPRGLQNKDS